LHLPRHFVGARHIGRKRQASSAALRNFTRDLLNFLPVASENGHLRACLGQTERRRAADARTAAGHKRNAILQFAHKNLATLRYERAIRIIAERESL
jgi:hypothetical protein